ncbi:hypothetical protein AVEN_134932-1 [Araneus ventricosus]|uniref:Endonuclease/exonuclease/phosphatase domain-containing protein n=1 Tax=Araneus ventricosus TaxID=182803 RepID=A0A4Y2CIH0_ARAVE|nr:hypothetical protein AVEN_134932-1 [Araneus ventricosus]
MRFRKEGTSHWVLEAPCEAFFNLRRLRKIPIKWAMYQMKEFLHIKRCSTCQAYGHTANSKECKFTTPFCGCCGLTHNTRNCKNYELYCINCAESNRNRGTNYKIRHRAIDKSSNEPLKILQINLARAKAATNQLQETASTIKPDVILVQEQYINNNGIPEIPQTWKTFSSSNQKGAILIPSPKLNPALLATKVNMVALKIQTSSFPITIISAYSSPAQDVHTTFQAIISSLPEEKIIIGADHNGHNNLWGYRSNDNRGKDILDFILANNLNRKGKQDTKSLRKRKRSTRDILSKQGIWVGENSAAQPPIRMEAVQGGVPKISFPISNPVLDKRRPKGKSARGSTKHPGADFPFPCHSHKLQSNHLNTAT